MFLFKRVPTISARELQGLLASRPTIIDVRETHEFVGGHIPGAKNVPLHKINNYKGSGKVYVVCQSGMRSKQAATILEKKGIDALNLKGGMMQWNGPIKGGKL